MLAVVSGEGAERDVALGARCCKRAWRRLGQEGMALGWGKVCPMGLGWWQRVAVPGTGAWEPRWWPEHRLPSRAALRVLAKQ